MRRRWTVGGLMLAAQIPGSAGAVAGPWEGGMAAYNRVDYVPAIQVFRAMAPEELSEARAMAQGCEASDYRSCEY